MSRPFNFPTPQGVTIGNPTMFVTADNAIRIYNQDTDNSPASKFSQSVKTWFTQEAYAVGWSKVDVSGDNAGLMLEATVTLVTKSDSEK